jgi:hypothetical protein
MYHPLQTSEDDDGSKTAPAVRLAPAAAAAPGADCPPLADRVRPFRRRAPRLKHPADRHHPRLPFSPLLPTEQDRPSVRPARTMVVSDRPEPSPAAANAGASPARSCPPLRASAALSASAAEASDRAVSRGERLPYRRLTLPASLTSQQQPPPPHARPRFIARPGILRRRLSRSIPRAPSSSRRPSRWPSSSTGSTTAIGTPPPAKRRQQPMGREVRHRIRLARPSRPPTPTGGMRALTGPASVSRAAWAASGGGGRTLTGQPVSSCATRSSIADPNPDTCCVHRLLLIQVGHAISMGCSIAPKAEIYNSLAWCVLSLTLARTSCGPSLKLPSSLAA